MKDKLEYLVSIIEKYWTKTIFNKEALTCQVFFDYVNVKFNNQEVLSIQYQNKGTYTIRIKPIENTETLYSYFQNEAEMAASLVVAETIRFAMQTEE